MVLDGPYRAALLVFLREREGVARFFLVEEAPFFFGTFTPARRAFERPMAMACLVDLADVRHGAGINPVPPARVATDDFEVFLFRELHPLHR